MKKYLMLVMAAVMSLSVVACSSPSDTTTTEGENTSSAYQDGTYMAEESGDHYGWKEYVSLTIEGGEIANVEYDGKNLESGALKTEDAAYNESMITAGSPVGPTEFMPQYIANFMETKQLENVDMITGATSTHTTFKTLVQAALDNAKTGNTELASVEIPETK